MMLLQSSCVLRKAVSSWMWTKVDWSGVSSDIFSALLMMLRATNC